MKTLVVFYSRTGITRKVAEHIAHALSSDVEEIIPVEDRTDFLGYALSREEAVSKTIPPIKATTRDPTLYDLTIIGTPVWVHTMASPVRAYISSKEEQFNHVAFFCTQDRSGGHGAFEEMETLCRRIPLDTLEILHEEVANGSYERKVEGFLARIRSRK